MLKNQQSPKLEWIDPCKDQHNCEVYRTSLSFANWSKLAIVKIAIRLGIPIAELIKDRDK